LNKSEGRFEIAVTAAKNRDWRIEADKWYFSFHCSSFIHLVWINWPAISKLPATCPSLFSFVEPGLPLDASSFKA
jgi:hypothetical protein